MTEVHVSAFLENSGREYASPAPELSKLCRAVARMRHSDMFRGIAKQHVKIITQDYCPDSERRRGDNWKNVMSSILKHEQVLVCLLLLII